MDGCVICRGEDVDEELHRVQVWSDNLWRLTTSTDRADVTTGFSYLEPRRHIPDLSELDGDEAATLGPTLARCVSALKRAADTDLVYVYVFGEGVPHLHLHLAPHREGDALNDKMIRGELVEERSSTGITRIVSKDFPAIPQERLREVADEVRRLMR